MSAQIFNIIEYITDSFIHIWPYLLITVPISVAVKMSGASRHIQRAFSARPFLAIILSTAVGAFSPLCSCSVIPVVAALLISGVPLAPVMSFWIASPSMDPEIFFLTVSTLGWELAVWRLGAALVLSLAGGFVTHALIRRGLLGTAILRESEPPRMNTFGQWLQPAWQSLQLKFQNAFLPAPRPNAAVSESAMTLPANLILLPNAPIDTCGCETEESSCGSSTSSACSIPQQPASFWKRLADETLQATTMVIKFMLLAWFLGALIRLYVPESWITSVLGARNEWAIVTAALFGIPVYTSNLMAMPLIGGLLAQGMHPAAALAFLIAGPTTTIPAMSAVWGLVNRRVFALYVGISLVGAIMLGYLYTLFM